MTARHVSTKCVRPLIADIQAFVTWKHETNLQVTGKMHLTLSEVAQQTVVMATLLCLWWACVCVCVMKSLLGGKNKGWWCSGAPVHKGACLPSSKLLPRENPILALVA